MTNGTLAIFDSDIDYLHRLSEYLRTREDFPYDIITFDNTDSLYEYSQKAIDILITSIIPELSSDKDYGCIFYLCTTYMKVYKGYPCIYKYQSADEILRILMEYCKNTALETGENRSNIIGIYSPVNRCGKTSLALSLGYALSEAASTLLISFDSFSYLNDFSDITPHRDLSDLLFYFKEAPDSLRNKLLTHTCKFYELNLICPPISPQRVTDIDSKLWCAMLELIAGLGLYQYIVIDISNLLQDFETVLKLCDRIYTPCIEDYPASSKINLFLDYLSCTTSLTKDSFTILQLPENISFDSKEIIIREIVTGKLLSFARNIVSQLTSKAEGGPS